MCVCVCVAHFIMVGSSFSVFSNRLLSCFFQCRDRIWAADNWLNIQFSISTLPTTQSAIFMWRKLLCTHWRRQLLRSHFVRVLHVVFARMIVCVHKMFCLILYEYDWIIIIMRRCQCASLSMRACVWNVWYIKENAERRWSDDSLAMFFSFCSFEPKLFGSWTKYT